MSEELKPCPHCGAAPNIHPQKVGDRGRYAVWCSSCNDVGPERRTTETAIAAWNTRAAAPEMAEALEGLIRRMDAFNASDRSQADAYYCLVKGGYAEWDAARAALAKARGR